MNSYSPSPSITATDSELGRRERSGLPALFHAYQSGDPAAVRYLLMMRFAIVNVVALAFLIAAWIQGWVGLVMVGDTTNQVVLIFVVFAGGLGLCAVKIAQTSTELNQIKEPLRYPRSRAAQYLQLVGGRDGHSRAICASALKLKLAGRINVVRDIANSLVLLGLIGTVIGFMMALSGVDPDQAGDVSAIGPMVSTLIGGMSVALTTTLVGAVLNIWLMVNYRLLESGTLRLFTGIVELGEQHVQHRPV